MEIKPLTQIGDELQSSASRLAEFVLSLPEKGGIVPYEAFMAALEARSAIKDWTATRSATEGAGE